MAVLADYKCEQHGYFESFDPKCPMKNCSHEVQMVFLKPVGLMSDNTKSNDKNIKQLAIDFNMTNIKSTREGETQGNYHTRNNQPAPEQREARPGDAVQWGNQGGKWDLGSLVKGRTFAPVRDEAVSIKPSDVGNLTPPKAASYFPDHENLKVDKPS